MVLNFMISVTALIIGLIGIFLGIWVIGRCKGSLRSSIMFLIIAIVIFVVKESFYIFNVTNFNVIRDIANIIIIIPLILSILSIKKIISQVDNNHNKKK